MTITNDINGTIRIGKDFVDAEIGIIKYKGEFTVSGKQYDYISSIDSEEVYKGLRALAEKEGKRLQKFMWQAV